MAPGPTAGLGRYSEHLVPECSVSSEEAIRRFSLSRDRTGMWKLAGVSDACACSFSDLATASIARGTRAMRKPATIEMWVDGLYICIHQPKGVAAAGSDAQE
jgi:hypothetical protein